MQFVLKYRWALIGTFLLHLLVMGYMSKVRIKTPYQPMGQLEQIPIILQEIPEEIKPEDPKDPQNQTGKITNITANEVDKTGQTDKKYDSRSFKNLDADVEKELREFEKNAFNEAASKHDPVKQYVEPDKNKTNKTNENNTNANDAGKVRTPGRVSGSYDLDGRADERFAKPAYVCKGSGTVVLKIKVNRNGKVVGAEIDRSKSSYTEECMGENSLAYVYKCKFEAGTKWPDPQSGTVTYTFISQ